MRNAKSLLRIGLGLLLMVALVGCNIDLNVENKNAPDAERALTTAQDIQNLVAGTFLNYFYGTHYYAPSMTLSTMADEGSSSWGNFSMREMSSVPRVAWNNSITYDADYQRVNLSPWTYLYRAISSSSDGLRMIDKGKDIEIDGVDHTARLQAFAKFIQGIAHGWLGCFYDQGFVMDETIDLETTKLDLKPYTDLVAKGVAALQECIALCEANTFTLPADWIKGNAFTQDDLKKLAHSYIARYLAAQARTVAERDAADWASIKNHADQGITADFLVYCDGNYWWSGLHYLGIADGWCRSDMLHVGTADTSGNFDAWLATPWANRTSFYIETPDLRFTSGDSTGVGAFDQIGTDYWYKYPVPFRPDRGTYHFTFYYHGRYWDHLLSGAASPVPDMKASELDMLRAEYWLRQGNAANAATEINKTRTTRGGLDPVDAADGIGTVADKPRITGSLWATFKYESNIELDRTGVGLAWMNDRGWGDLVQNTAIHFPVPARELEVLQLPSYTFGGGGPGSAPKMMPHIPARY
ncbi:MAG TPA: hypothetical protein ENN03_10895 [bacterium]|nr:hypothetical protein [bacterium]